MGHGAQQKLPNRFRAFADIGRTTSNHCRNRPNILLSFLWVTVSLKYCRLLGYCVLEIGPNLRLKAGGMPDSYRNTTHTWDYGTEGSCAFVLRDKEDNGPKLMQSFQHASSSLESLGFEENDWWLLTQLEDTVLTGRLSENASKEKVLAREEE